MCHRRCSTCNNVWRNQEQLEIHQRHSRHGNYGMGSIPTEHGQTREIGGHSWLAQSDPAWTTPPVQRDRPVTRSTPQPTTSQPATVQPTTSWPIRPLSHYVNGQLVSATDSDRLIPVAVVPPYDPQPERSMRQSTVEQRVLNIAPPHNVIIIIDNTDNQAPGTSSTDIITLD